VQKPDGLTTFSRPNSINYIYLSIKFLTLAFSGQFNPTKSGLSLWFFLASRPDIAKEVVGCSVRASRVVPIPSTRDGTLGINFSPFRHNKKRPSQNMNETAFLLIFFQRIDKNSVQRVFLRFLG
jgi:hypothetical protein